MDMTKGNIIKLLIKFSLPLMLSAVLQQLYSWADAFIVGNIDGEMSLAAIGATSSVVSFLVYAITGFTGGLAIIAAQYFGQGNMSKVRYLLWTFNTIFLALSVSGSALMYIYSDEILIAYQTPEEIFDLAKVYMEIYLIGIPFICIYNIYASILRGIGDSRLPFMAVIISSVLNIILDIILVGPMHMSTAGAALATTISQIVMMTFIIVAGTRKHEIVRFDKTSRLIHGNLFKRGLIMGIPMMIQSSITTAGGIILQGFMNSFGMLAIAGITTAYRVDSIMLVPIVNLGIGMSTLIAQNVGAGNMERAKKSLRQGTVFVGIVSIALGFFVMFCGGHIVGIFGLSEGALAVGKEFFYYLGPFYFTYGLTCALKGYLEARSKVMITCILTVAALVVRVFVSYLIVGIFSYNTVALAEGIAWVFNLLAVAIYLGIVLKQDKKKALQLQG